MDGGDNEKAPRQNEVWRHARFDNQIRVDGVTEDGLVRFHSVKSERDRRTRRYSTERCVKPADFQRMFQYRAEDQSSEEDAQ